MTNPTSVPIVSPRMQQLQAEQEAGRARVAFHAGERARLEAQCEAVEAIAATAAKDAAKDAMKASAKVAKAKPLDDEPL